MRNLYKKLVLLLLGSIVLVFSASAQMPYYPIYGYVTATSESGERVASREVLFYRDWSSGQVITAETDAYGSFEVNVFDLNYYYDVPITFETATTSETYYLAIQQTGADPYGSYGTGESVTLPITSGYVNRNLVIVEEGTPLGGATSGAGSLRASIVDGKVVLDWLPVDSAIAYNIYRGSEPYFSATTAALITSEITGTAFVDEFGNNRLQWEDSSGAGVNDSANNYYYALTSIVAHTESPISNRVGEFTYDLTKSAPTDYVWIAYVLDTNYSRTPVTTLSALGALIPNLTAGYPQYFDVETQQLLPTEHTLSIGEAIQLKITASGVLQLTGGVTTTAFSLEEKAPTDYNWASLPLNHEAATLVTLATEIGSLAPGYPQYFDVASQQPLSSENLIYGGTPLQLKMTGRAVWPSLE